ncbi:MAG: hypothetical protein ACRCX2_15130 [Paraclostridium sp.]
MEKTQMIFSSHEDFLNNVIDIKEASNILNLSDGYIRQLILKGEFEPWEYKKFSRNIIFYKPSITTRRENFNKK